MPGVDAADHSEKARKVTGYELYRDVLGSPKFVVAPMVDQSELPWRILSRRYGAQLVYTPMIHAKMFSDPRHKSYREEAFNTKFKEEGGPQDRPLIVQFCANDPEQLLQAAKQVEPYCDAVDINFGCPQDIARRGRYGCYLQDDWDLVFNLINILHENLSIPVTAKFRVFPSLEKTIAYAQMMERAGAQILTCHGRTREQRGHNSGLADWEKIQAVKNAVSVPVFANGNILFHSDIQKCLDVTGADAVMTAEGNLYNPTILTSIESLPSVFSNPASPPSPGTQSPTTSTSRYYTFPGDPGVYLPVTDLALEYLSILKSLKTPTATSAVKGHLFKLMRPALGIHKDLREQLGRLSRGQPAELFAEYEKIVRELHDRLQPEIKKAETTPLEEFVQTDLTTGLRVLPHWLAQPYFRPLPEQKSALLDLQRDRARDLPSTTAPSIE